MTRIPFLPWLVSLCLGAGLVSSASADTITGRVVNDAGVGQGNVDIDAFLFSNGNPVTVSGDFTAGDGTFTMVVPPGTFSLEFKPASAGLFNKIVEPVTPGGSLSLGDVILPKAATLSGRVATASGTGIAGVNIDVVDTLTNINQPIKGDVTPANGQFSIKVPVGALEVQFEAPGTGTLYASHAVEMTVTKNTSLGTITLEPGLRLMATLQRSNGNPVVGADTDVRDTVTGLKLFTPGDNSNGSGTVSLVVPAGTYDFVAQPLFADGLASLMVSGVVMNGDKNLGILVHQDGVVLSGTVTSDGLPVADIDVDLHDPADGSEIPLAMDNTNFAGAYAIVVPLGTWDVIFSPVNGESLAPAVFPGVVINADTTLDASLLACQAPCDKPPVLTVLPPAGPPDGGNLVTLRGSGFVGDASTTVLFGSTPATIESITPPQTLVVQAPAGSKDTTVSVTVSDSGGSQVLDDPYTYGDLSLELGHTLEGTLPAGDVDRVFVEVVGGSKLNLALRTEKGGSLQPRLAVIGPDGVEELSADDSVVSPKQARAKKLLLGQTGTYTLELSSADGSTGGYQLRTKVKTPRKQKLGLVVDGATPTATVAFGARAGWELKKATIKSKKSKSVPFGPFQPALTLLDPSGVDEDITGLTTVNKNGTAAKVSGLPLDSFGQWRFQVSSASAATGQATAVIALKIPKTPKATIVETP